VPNNASQAKRLRQSRERRMRNRRAKSEIRTRTKNVLATETREAGEEALSALYRALDRAARKRIVAPRHASRQKSRAARHVATLS